ncbi:hypothetical protein C8F01DRAFT_1113532 [Mycena amicta]|nr:hypothetical protein C8F01DRAFT_1113532 [Mycena amicta]
MSTGLALNDRKAVDKLHVPLNNRDASQSSSATWSKPATLISIPRSTGASNPFSGGRTQDNLHAQKGGNVVASQTLSSFAAANGAKRQKLDSQRSRKRVSNAASGSGRPRPRLSDEGLIVVSREQYEQDEDIGELVQLSDPSYDRPHAVPDGAATMDIRRQHTQRPLLAPDEQESRRIQHSAKETVDLTLGEEDDDEIETSSSPPKGQPPKGKVHTMIQKLEGRTQLSMQSHQASNRSKSTSHPLLDLASLPGPTVAKVKNGMKPKNGQPTKSQAQEAGPSKPRPPPKSAASGQPISGFLPILSWCLGGKKFDPPFHLEYHPLGKLVFRSTSRPNPTERTFHIEEIDMRAEAKSVEYVLPEEESSEKIFVLQLYEKLEGKKSKGFGSSYSKYFKAGAERAQGKITVHLGQVKRAEYETFIDWIKKFVNDKSTMRGAAGKAAWDMAFNHAEMAITEDKRAARSSRSQSVKSAPTDDESTDELLLQRPGAAPTPKTGKDRARQAISGSLIDLAPDDPPARTYAQRATRSAGVRSRSQSQAPSEQAQRRSTRKSGPPPGPVLDPDEVILVYPPGQTGAVNITNGDMTRLQPGEFLNDTLIEFGLKLWLQQLEKDDPDLAKQIHVFSSFFYKKLNKRNFEEGYGSVAKWTSKFDLFDKKYIIIPINENLHWYLAIIYRPEHVLQPEPPLPTPTANPPSTRSRGRDEAASETDQVLSPHFPLPDSKATTLSRDSPQMEDRASVSAPISPSSHQAEAEVVAELTGCSIEDDVEMDDTDAKTLSGKDSPFVETMEVDIPTGASPRVPDMDIDDPDTSIDPINLSAYPPSPAPVSNILEPPATATSRFYSKPPGKRKATSPPPPPSPPRAAEVRLNSPVDDEVPDEEVEVVNGDQPRTYVFTLDSLGSRHPRVGKLLNQYLRQEALEKKKVPMEGSSRSIYKHALVPHQPNFCDCGIYLLHLAQTFISDPDKFNKIILTKRQNYAAGDRQVDWSGEATKNLRESLRLKIEELSVDWKKERAAKELEKKQQDADVVPGSSDSDIDIVDTVPAPQSKKPNAKSPKKKKLERMR